MSPSDPISALASSVAKDIVGPILKQAEDFIAAVLGEEGKSIGTMLGNMVARRGRNLIKITGESNRALIEVGVSPQAVPLKTMYPALEAASLEEDPDLQARWANLLANAADPRLRNPVEFAFPKMLGELSSREVKFLDALAREVNGVWDIAMSERGLVNTYVSAGLAPATYVLPRESEYRQSVQVSPRDFLLMLDILKKLQIITQRATVENIRPEEIIQISQATYEPESLSVPFSEHYEITKLGGAFIRACQKPER